MGHPPIYDDNRCGRNYSQTQSFEEDKNIDYKNIKTDNEDNIKDEKNKGSIINIATTTAN